MTRYYSSNDVKFSYLCTTQPFTVVKEAVQVSQVSTGFSSYFPADKEVAPAMVTLECNLVKQGESTVQDLQADGTQTGNTSML